MDLKRKPQVTVIMPAYNAAEYIEEAIRSVQAQTVSDWELIVLDDCSTDDSAVVVERLAKEDGRIRLLRNEKNLGVARTRNRGLELIRGSYAALLDSDDYWKPQLLEKMIARAEQTCADIVFCSYEIVDELGRPLCDDFVVPEETRFADSIVRSVITCSTVLLSAEVATKHRFPTDLYHEDIALWFRLLRDGYKAAGVTDVLAAYRQHSDSRASNKLLSAARRWPIYRKHLGMSVMESAAAMLRYGWYGLKKYRRI